MSNVADALKRDGIFKLPAVNVKPMLRYLSGLQPIYGGHVPRFADGIDPKVSCYSLEESVNCPGLILSALSYLEDVREFFDGEEPLLYSVNIFTTYRFGASRADINYWHRDVDDRKQAAIFTLLSDTPASAAHVYLNEHQIEIFGKAGTRWIENPYGLHYGKRPKIRTKARTLAWARFAVSDPPEAYVNDGNQPIATELYNQLSDEQRRVCRLLVKDV